MPYNIISDHYQEILSLIFKVIICDIIQEQYALFRGKILNQNRPCTEDAKTYGEGKRVPQGI